MHPEISVFTALYNHERYIYECINSALNQTLSPAEIIVLDDASTDNSLEVLQSINQPLIKTVAETNNFGGANTCRGLEECSSEFIAILNSDDAWDSEKLQKQLGYITSSSDIGAVFTHIHAIDESGAHWANGSLSHLKAFNVANRSRYEWLRHFFLHGNPFCASSALIRKECLNETGSFNGSYIQLQDLDMWMRIALDGYNLYVVEEPLTYYRIMRNGGNMSSAHSGARATNSFEYAKILRNYWKIQSLEELIKIFPDLHIAEGADDSLVLYYLALYSIKLPNIHHKLFALETMSKWGGDRDALDVAYKCHGFDFSEYRNFFTHGPIRALSRLTLHHNLNSLAFKFLPTSVYQGLRNLLLRNA